MRLDKLRSQLEEENLDAFVVSAVQNQFYLAGFAGHEDFDSVLLISRDDARVVTDSRYWEAAEQSAQGYSLVKTIRGEHELTDAIRDFAKAHESHKIGFEANHVPYNVFRDWRKATGKAGAKLVPTNQMVNRLRAVKDQPELEAIQRAVRLTDAAFEYFRTRAQPGMTEKQGAWLIEVFMREQGGDGLAFAPIVASGPNAALPHAEPTDRAFETGEPITVDIGVRVGHYNSDLTRTICLGEPTERFDEVYKIVLQAMQAAEKKARAGLRGKQVDALARRVIEKAGYGENFGHGLGHGVGLAVHELPRANKVSKDVLEANMTLTVEPGIYVSGWGGVRIEDLVVIQDDGVQVLSQATKDPIVRLNGK